MPSWECSRKAFYGEGWDGSAVGGTSVGTSVGGIAVNVGTAVFSGRGVWVEMRVGAAVVLASRSEVLVVDALTEGFVPQSLITFIQLVTSLCSTAGPQVLKKS